MADAQARTFSLTLSEGIFTQTVPGAIEVLGLAHAGGTSVDALVLILDPDQPDRTFTGHWEKLDVPRSLGPNALRNWKFWGGVHDGTDWWFLAERKHGF